jgi:hypothetical protein
MAKVIIRQTALELYGDISTLGLSEPVALLKTVDASVQLNTASRVINDKNEDDNGKLKT